MPELPDIEAYLYALRMKISGQTVRGVRLKSIFLVRSTEPPLTAIVGRRATAFERIGKRLLLGFEDDLEERIYVVLHLMIAGRLHWRKPGVGLPGKRGLCAIDFENGTLMLTEASTQKRASVHVEADMDGVASHDPDGLELHRVSVQEFAQRLKLRNHTLKRALTDPRLFSGIGGAYGDEIMHRARLSPIVWTTRMDDDEVARLLEAAREVLAEWTRRLKRQVDDAGWPVVTAFQSEMNVHGKYGQPCPVCGTEIQRIVYASNETNYCPACQTNGKILADRSLSRILKQDWPRSIEELERLRRDPG